MASKQPPEGIQDNDNRDVSEDTRLETVGAEPVQAPAQAVANKAPLNLAQLKVE